MWAKPWKVNFDLLMGAYNISYENKLLAINMTRHLLVLDVNGLLCETCYLKSMKIWKPLIPTISCGNKFINPWTHFQKSLELCGSHIDTSIWSTTFANLRPMVDFLLGGWFKVKTLVSVGFQKMFRYTPCPSTKSIVHVSFEKHG